MQNEDVNKISVSFGTPALVGGLGDKKSNRNSHGVYTQWFQQDRVYSSNYIAMCHPQGIPGGSYLYLVNRRLNNE